MNAMAKNLNIDKRIRDLHDTDGRHLEFAADGITKNIDFEEQRQLFVDHAVQKWSKVCRSAGFHSDTQLATASRAALTAFQDGFYLKSALEARWASGELLTLTDQGVHAGDRDIETTTHGAFHRGMNKGVTAPDQLPERAVEVGESTYTQSYAPVRDMANVTVQEIAEAAKRNFSAMELKGEVLRRQHDQNLNDLIREGLTPMGLDGITNHPGIRHYASQVDWGSASPADIWDEWRVILRLTSNSATQDGVPTDAVLPPVQFDYIDSEQNSLASDLTFGAWIQANKPIKLSSDFGMKTVDSNGNPGAIFYFNESRLVRVTMPFWLLMHPPFDKDQLTMNLLVESRFAGVQIQDVDKVTLVEGTTGGWQAED